jgi:hypothetical protein
MKRVFDLTELTTPGTQIFSTETFSPISVFIRGAEEAERLHSLIGGIEAFVNPSIPSHSFLISHVTSGGNIMCSEMTWPYEVCTSHNGNNIFDLTVDYDLNQLGNHVCGVFRAPCLDDDYGLQAKATDWMRTQHKLGLQYGIMNLFADLGIGKINNREEVCIQYCIAFHIWLQNLTGSFTLPSNWIIDKDKPNVISLQEFVIWAREQGWAKNYVKEVADDFDPHKEIEV